MQYNENVEVYVDKSQRTGPQLFFWNTTIADAIEIT